jgi:putative nucleotidyltransferase with HDIG domain
MFVSQLVDQRTSSASLVARAISADSALTERVLKIANCPFYCSPRRISSLTDAIVLLGMRAIRDIALSASCYDLLMREASLYSLERGALWLHSNCCGYAAQLIARHARYPAPEDAYVAGLLHDIGKVSINEYMSSEAAEVYQVSQDENISYCAAERKVLGFDHALVGSRICETWNIPSVLVEAIRLHHDPAELPNASVLASIIHVADFCCMMAGAGIGSDGLRYNLDERALTALDLDNDTIEQILSGLVEFGSIQSPA